MITTVQPSTGVLRNYASILLGFLAISSVTISAFAQTDRVNRSTTPTIRRVAAQHAPHRVDADAGMVQAAYISPVTPAKSRSVPSTNTPQPSDARRPVASVRPVGFLEDFGTPSYSPIHGCDGGCGPACNCGGDGIVYGEPACGIESYAEPACGCEGPCHGACGTPGCHVDRFPLLIPILHIDWSRFTFFAGTQAFKGPVNYPAIDANGTRRVGSGSFGFHQGFNEGRDLRPWIGLDLSAQLGIRATQSNLDGDSFTTENRNQVFVTGGLFRRVDYGLQYGVVLDYLNDDWYYQADLLQLRGELSWRATACHEFGFQFATGLGDETIDTSVTTPAGTTFASTRLLEAADQYRGFYRRSFGNDGTWTAFIGGTNQEHLILGNELEVPLQKYWSASFGSTYFSPGGDVQQPDHRAEGWNVSVGMVFRPGMGNPRNRYRNPMFNVADNGSFFAYGR